MRRVILTALCTATVEEAWSFDVTDEIAETLTGLSSEEVYDLLMGPQWSPAGVEFGGVENVKVDDERDRTWKGHGIETLPLYGTQAACSRCGTDIEFVTTEQSDSERQLGIDPGNGWWDRGGNYDCPKGVPGDGTHTVAAS
jgi:hypothetical protein